MTTFADLGLSAHLVEALTSLGYEEPTPIQIEAIPPLLAGRDLLGRAATGTGKTAAFALPLLQRLSATAPVASRPSLLVLVPTRELAMQVAEAFHRYGKALGTSVVAIYGGQAFDQQIRALRRGVHVVVATPGRALDHLRRGTLSFEGLTAVVLDEADEMLDMGFADDLESLLDAAPANHQTALFSATFAGPIATIAERHLHDPVRCHIDPDKPEPGDVPRVRQTAYILTRAQKIPALARVLDIEAPTLALIFCRTRTEVDALTETLVGHGYGAEALHGGMSQEARDRVMRKTRSGAVDLLVATDVAARGLDIEQLSHVINFNVPESPGAYVHRIGRTGRAGREGVAITFLEPKEHRLIRSLEAAARQRITVSKLPTILDVQARRLGLTTAAVREAVIAGGGEPYRVVIETLAQEYDLMEIAIAAVRVVHERGFGAGTTNGDEIADTVDRGPRSSSKVPGGGRSGTMARIYIGAGRKQKMRPADVVGAIVNEAHIDPAEIGTIEIADNFALVEIAEDKIDSLVKVLRASTIKGKRLTVRRDLASRSMSRLSSR